jgi:hypothetical protein
MNKKKKNILGYYIIGSALIWGATILGCALILKETFAQISLLFSSAAGIHLIIIWGPLAAQLKKQREENNHQDSTKE